MGVLFKPEVVIDVSRKLAIHWIGEVTTWASSVDLKAWLSNLCCSNQTIPEIDTDLDNRLKYIGN